MDFSKEIRQKNNNEQERWKINCLVHANSEDSDLHVRMYMQIWIFAVPMSIFQKLKI